MWRSKVSGRSAVRLYRSFSLLEVLLSISLGTTVMFILSQFYADVIYLQHKQRILLNLQQQSHQLLNYMQQHISHIGYQGRNREGSNFDLFKINGKSYQLVNQSCFLFFYDLNHDGCLGSRNKKQGCQLNQVNNTKDVNKEIFGFTLRNRNLYLFDDGDFKRCYQQQCQNWAKNCSDNKWNNVSELSDYQVERLQFNWEVPESLLRIELTLSSIQLPDVKYSATAYSYLLNK